MGPRRIFECLQPGTRAPAVRMRNAVGIEGNIECPWDQPQHPDPSHPGYLLANAFRALPAGHPGEHEVVERFGRHGPRRRIQKCRDRGDPTLQQDRRQHNPGPKHPVRMGRIFLRQHSPAQQQAQQIDGVDARESRFPEANFIEFPVARPLAIVVAKHKSGQQDEIAHRRVTGIDHRRQPAKPLWIGKMEENNV